MTHVVERPTQTSTTHSSDGAANSREHRDSVEPAAEGLLVTTTGIFSSLLNPLKCSYDGIAVLHRGVAGQAVKTTARLGIGTIDAYERSLSSLLTGVKQIAEGSRLAWLGALVAAHADVVASVSSTGSAVARKALQGYAGTDRTAADRSLAS